MLLTTSRDELPLAAIYSENGAQSREGRDFYSCTDREHRSVKMDDASSMFRDCNAWSANIARAKC